MVNRKHLILIMSVVAAASVCGCTEDSRFDYENISSNLKNEEITLFQNGISIPVGSTKEMRLDSIIAKVKSENLEKYLKVNNGQYELQVNGEYDFDNILGSFDMSEMAALNALSGEMSFNNTLPSGGLKGKGLGVQTIPEIKFDVNLEKNLASQLKLDVPAMVVAIGALESSNPITVNVTISEEGVPAGINYLDMDVTVTLPKIFVPNTIAVKERMKLSSGKGSVNTNVKLEKLDFSAISLDDLRAGTLSDDKISIKGTMSSTNVSIDPDNLDCTVACKAAFSIKDKNGELAFNKMSAKIDYQKDTNVFVNALSFDFPDIISEFKADFPAIQATANLCANCSIPINLGLDAYLVKGTTPDKTSPLFSQEFTIPYSTNGQMVTNSKTFGLDINRFFNEDPDSLQLHILAKSDKTQWAVISSDMNYSLGATYEFKAPVQLGTEFKIELKDTIDLDSSMSPILEKNPVCIKAKAENTLPLGIKLNLSLLCEDESGAQSVQNTSITGNLEIKAGTTSDIELTLKAGSIPAGQTIKGLIFVATATSNGQNLKPENYIKFNSISLKLPEGITYDLNSNNE